MDADIALEEIHAPQSLSIVSLSQPYVSGANNNNYVPPSMLAADLVHYQELFSKLRFSYVEQVTKERFLRSITAEQPDFVDQSGNAKLEVKLKQDKAALKDKKQEVRDIVKDLEEQSRHLAEREC